MEPILNDEATKAYNQGVHEGVIDESKEWIINTVLEQEIVTFCTSEGQYSFDIYDLIKGGV
tara:strand:+ start:1529 stop:1711 length:183 start_codon:yes stop_codon:yes gene_type:complete